MTFFISELIYSLMQFAMETWGIMEEKKVTLRRTCCFRVVESLCKGGYIKEVRIRLYVSDEYLLVIWL